MGVATGAPSGGEEGTAGVAWTAGPTGDGLGRRRGSAGGFGIRFGTAAFDSLRRDAGRGGVLRFAVLRRACAPDSEADFGLRVRVVGFWVTFVATRVAFGRAAVADVAGEDLAFAGAEGFGAVRALGRGGEPAAEAWAGPGLVRGVRDAAAEVARGAERRFCDFMGQALPPEEGPAAVRLRFPGVRCNRFAATLCFASVLHFGIFGIA